MHWLTKIYDTLDETYKDDLEKFGMSSEEIIKDMFLRARHRLMAGEDLLIHFLGTFKINPHRIYYEAHDLYEIIKKAKAKENPNTERIKMMEERLKFLVDVYNRKKEKKSKRNKMNYMNLSLTENGLESDGAKGAKGFRRMGRERKRRTDE